MDDLALKMDGVTVEEVLAATEPDLALAPELARRVPQKPQWEKQHECVT